MMTKDQQVVADKIVTMLADMDADMRRQPELQSDDFGGCGCFVDL